MNHPITPPPELVSQWLKEFYEPETMPGMAPGEMVMHVATIAARWGADQELEACVNHVDTAMSGNKARALRAARRPKPPSLKEQALDAWDRLRNEAWCKEIDYDLDFVRRALEALDG